MNLMSYAESLLPGCAPKEYFDPLRGPSGSLVLLLEFNGRQAKRIIGQDQDPQLIVREMVTELCPRLVPHEVVDTAYRIGNSFKYSSKKQRRNWRFRQ